MKRYKSKRQCKYCALDIPGYSPVDIPGYSPVDIPGYYPVDIPGQSEEVLTGVQVEQRGVGHAQEIKVDYESNWQNSGPRFGTIFYLPLKAYADA